MTQSGPEVAARLDALVPPETARRAFVAALDLGPHAQTLSWSAFVLRNLLPVTIGNVIGGTLIVGIVYWFVHIRARTEA